MRAELDEIIKKLYFEWGVSSYLSEEEYDQFVRDSYGVIVNCAKQGNTIFYGELPSFNVLWTRFADGVRKVIGFIVGACSEYETANDCPPISAIVITKDTGEPGDGFYGLSVVPRRLSMEMWELRGRKPTAAVVSEREAFWLEQLRKVFDYWRGR
jgi:hypothetical protein